jgi:two-component system cell cycle response regulator
MSARILLVEDNRTNLDLMIYLLEAFGYRPAGVTDPLAGLEAARSGDYDLVASDVLMPGIDGFEFARRFKADGGRCKLIAVTAIAMAGDRERLLEAGFNDYIAKPIEPERFVSQIEAHLPPALLARPQRAGPLILVVDDIPVNRAVVRSTLEPFGYRIEEAESVRHALQGIQEIEPALVLCDVHMPDGNGSELLEKMKATPHLAHIPFVFLTGTAWQTSERLRGKSLGAHDFLLRPIDPARLLKAVSDALHGLNGAEDPDR